jgi:hypothetical protein
MTGNPMTANPLDGRRNEATGMLDKQTITEYGSYVRFTTLLTVVQ